MLASVLGNLPDVHGVAVPPPRPELVQTTDHYYHVGVRPKEAFTELRTTQDAADRATSVVGPGADVREGRVDSDAWVVESVLVPLEDAENGPAAEALVERLVDRLEP